MAETPPVPGSTIIHEAPPQKSGPTDAQLMESIHNLALKGETEPIRVFVEREKGREADDAASRPIQTMDEYLAELAEQSRPKKPGERLPLTPRRYGEEVLAVLDVVGRRSSGSVPERPKPVEATEPLELPPVEASLPEESRREAPPAVSQAPEGVETEVPERETSETSKENQDTPAENGPSGYAGLPGTEIIDLGTVGDLSFEEAVRILEEKLKAESPALQQVPPHGVENLSLDGSGQARQFVPAVGLAPESKPEEQTPKDTQQAREPEPDFVETLNGSDRNLWDEIVRIGNEQEDGVMSDRLEELQDDFTPEHAGTVVSLAEARAQRQAEEGNQFRAQQLTELADDIRELNEHVSGLTISRAA